MNSKVRYPLCVSVCLVLGVGLVLLTTPLYRVQLSDQPVTIVTRLYVTGLTVVQADTDDGQSRIYDCKIFKPEELDEVQTLLLTLDQSAVELPFRTMMQLMETCEVTTNHTPSGANNANSSRIHTMMSGILPGTKWCGLGDLATSYDDLGEQADVDQCCRFHDHCPVRIHAFKTRWGTSNPSLYTKSHCGCDERFMKCLKNVNSPFANAIGQFFFNVIKAPCIEQEERRRCTDTRNGNCTRWETIPTLDNTLKVVSSPLKY